MQPATRSDSNRYVAFRSKGSASDVRLLCFPFAGGSAMAFRPLMDAMPGHVQTFLIELPGRGTRVTESLQTDMSALIDDLVNGLQPLCTPPFALYGHSMGASIALRLALAMRDRHGVQPCRLIVSGARAPQLTRPREQLHRLSDDALIGRLRKMGGTLPALFDNPELRALMLRIVRADFELLENAGSLPVAPLDCPIEAFGGSSDPFAEPESMEGWRFQTRGAFRRTLMPGDHFFFRENIPGLAHAIGRALREDARKAVAPEGSVAQGMTAGSERHG